MDKFDYDDIDVIQKVIDYYDEYVDDSNIGRLEHKDLRYLSYLPNKNKKYKKSACMVEQERL